MLNFLIATARVMVEVGVVIAVVAGVGLGGGLFGAGNREVGYVVGGVVGFLVSAAVFGLAAAVLDMQNSLRVLVEAARRASPHKTGPDSPPEHLHPSIPSGPSPSPSAPSASGPTLPLRHG